ncbi:hypothetical protein [Methanoculleus sp.]|uniref:hypothetical protein n=1 Tax=Methanoculleus sp. TaxID=90427 RepID=UPI0025F27FC5|nr:hypothetical protein [Methanoculleus sp.]MCK9319367.1 hypothetical protein [Methanoculleus sp.]
MTKKYPIMDAVNGKEKLLVLSITDKRGEMFDLVVPYINPATIFSNGFLKICAYEAMKRRLTLKDSHIQTTRKEREFVITSSMIASESYYSAANIDNIVVISADNVELYDSMKLALEDIISKIETTEKEIAKK